MAAPTPSSTPYQVIARKYRPQGFGELIGQESVKTTIENAIAQRRIAHGYIFAGQRGTGKTTVARILARCLNCVEGPTATPCGKCSSCVEIGLGSSMDVIEIDAASNRGINEMRELRENVRFRPARDRYKVFIVDEAHQITNEAFNALLKTLEEPPEWVVFILCTTETHKIPTTIASRCQQFSFRSVDFHEVMERLREICGKEGVTADEDALAVIAQAGEGSVRDSLSALDQAIAACGNDLTGGAVRELLGRFSLDALGRVTDALEGQDARQMLEIVAELESSGGNMQHFCRELARYFRNLMVAKVAGEGTRLIAASANEQKRLAAVSARFSEEDLTRYLRLTIELFKDLQFSLQPRLHLELGLVRLVQAGRLKSIEEILGGLGSGPAAAVAAPAATTGVPKAPPPVATPPAAPAPAPSAAPAVSGSLKQRLHAHLTEAAIMMTADAVEHADVAEAGGEVMFTAPPEYTLALRDPALAKALQAVLGRPAKVKVVSGQASSSEPVQKKKSDSNINEEAEKRALAHPEVQKFQELFPDAQIRAVRDLSNS
ncbi:MAG: DNA polymerase III subunit gamma/tau [Bryobacteraceae bacterium]|nr:DNA polymerase III subunit gamma/tau [Bryobacteraceae bacterium]